MEKKANAHKIVVLGEGRSSLPEELQAESLTQSL